MKEKKSHKKRAVILAVAVVAVMALGAVGYSFCAPRSVVGDWAMIINPEVTTATPDEIDDADRAYYTFEKMDENSEGVYRIYYDGGVEEGSYTISEKDGKKVINLGTEDLAYSITGSGLFGNLRLTFVYPEYTDEQTGQSYPAEEYVFAQAKAPEYEVMSYDAYETDESLVAEWVTTERFVSYYDYQLSYTETVNFGDNGIMTIRYESADLALDRYLYYAYTAKEGSLTFSLVTEKEAEHTVLYGFDEEGNLHFIEEAAPTSIFADAVFSDVTYYPTAGEDGE